MTLSWGLLFKLMPAADRGGISGLATTTKGVGLLIGPLLAGVAIDLLSPYLEETNGYAVLWPILGVPIVLAIPLVAGSQRQSGDVGPREPESPEPIV